MSRSAAADPRFPFPFVESGPDRRKVKLWSPKETGDWSRDNEIGRGYADELVTYMRDRRDPAMLGRVVGSMIKRERYGGVEVGFLQRIGEACL